MDHGIQSHHLMGKDGETIEIVTDFILGFSKSDADGDYSHVVKGIASPAVKCECESWSIKNIEDKIVDALNIGVGEESLGWQGEQTSQS